MNNQIIGSLLVEVNVPGEPGYHGVVEIAIIETPTGEIYPGGIRDADTLRHPKRVPPVSQVKEAMEIAKWCYSNKAVFEGLVSKEPKWDIAEDLAINSALTEELGPDDDDPELN